MGWLITLGVLIFLAVLPLGVSVIYDAGGAGAWILAGPLRLRVFPRTKKEKKPEPEKTARKPAGNAENPKAAPAKKGGSWTDFLPLVRVGLDFLGDLRRKIRVRRMELRLCMAGDDPCDLAVNYGRANAAMGALLAGLNRAFVIRRQQVAIDCDYTAEEMTIYARLDVTLTLGRAIALLGRYGIRGLRTYLSISKNRKGGAKL